MMQCRVCSEVRPLEKFRKKHYGYEKVCVPCQSARKKERRKDPEVRRRSNSAYTKWRYGITLDDKEAMLAAQGGCCAACKSSDPGGVHGWHIDHSHETGVVRGILCHPCNVAIGSAKEDIDRLLACIAYLERNL